VNEAAIINSFKGLCAMPRISQITFHRKQENAIIKKHDNYPTCQNFEGFPHAGRKVGAGMPNRAFIFW
jgi:hypothetical protein